MKESSILAKGVKFRYYTEKPLEDLFEDFGNMVNLCVEKALEQNTTSFCKLWKIIYDEWKERWYPKYHTHYCHSACRVAVAMVKRFRKMKRKGLTRKMKPEVRRNFIKLDKELFIFEGSKLRIVTAPRRYIEISLTLSDYHRKFIEAWKKRELGIGEIIIKEDCIIVPFKKIKMCRKAERTMTIDINEKNITYSIFDGEDVIKTLRLDIYKVKRIHDEYSKKRERIQRKLAKKPLKMRRILTKYSEREKRRVNDLLHKVSCLIVKEADRYNAKIVMEDLKGIGNSINRIENKRFRRRLHRWNFKRLESFIEYKANWRDLDVEYVSPSYTSSLCPVCGFKLCPSGRRLVRCGRCGIEFDRDVVATMNLYIRGKSGCGEIRSPRTLPDEAWIITPSGTGEEKSGAWNP